VRLQLLDQWRVDNQDHVRHGHEVRRLFGLDYATARNKLGVRPSGPVQFRVIWGDPAKGMAQEVVEAFDVDEALVRAHGRRPDLPRPRVAFLMGSLVAYNSPDELTL